ncbi:unnamed protein product [Rhizophagus irregularis]|nr:unnamed protein product [Rhizophagus irregularis]
MICIIGDDAFYKAALKLFFCKIYQANQRVKIGRLLLNNIKIFFSREICSLVKVNLHQLSSKHTKMISHLFFSYDIEPKPVDRSLFKELYH